MPSKFEKNEMEDPNFKYLIRVGGTPFYGIICYFMAPKIIGQGNFMKMILQNNRLFHNDAKRGD